MSTYTPTIGLEIHAELKTDSKMFCGCKNAPNQETPNIYVCPVCMAHPGTLPVINKEAVKQVLRVGDAVGGTFADFTEFDRKNYFYPDIPKNYQISQYKHPLISGGGLVGVDITRIHLEEDTARSVHDDGGSNVDYNRSGVPLMELVTEPVIHDAKTAVRFAKELRLVLLYLDASYANLEKGEMRIEANISVAKDGEKLGTKVEVKNLNSFKAVEQAIDYEIKRHTKLIESGNEGKIVQETRGWDENKQKTFSQRVKEESQDYRYCPDPDLPKLYISEIPDFDIKKIHASLSRLPWELREKYKSDGMKEQTVELLVGNIALNIFYEKVAGFADDSKQKVLIANYITSDLLGLIGKSDYKGVSIQEMDAKEFAELIRLVVDGTLSSRGAKNVLSDWVLTGGSVKEIAEKIGALQISDKSELNSIVDEILDNNENVVNEYIAGKESALQYLIGQGMKATKGAANPNVIKDIFIQKMQK